MLGKRLGCVLRVSLEDPWEGLGGALHLFPGSPAAAVLALPMGPQEPMGPKRPMRQKEANV